MALELAEAPNRFLATVQTGITLIGILAGAFGGATIAQSLAVQLNRVAPLGPYSEVLGLGIVVLGITYRSLVLGELVPKRIALNNPERITSAVAAPMRALSALTFPAVHLLSISTEGVLRMFRVQKPSEPPVTEEEIRVLINQGAQAGVFEEAEQGMMEGVFRLSGRRVGALMTPRIEIVWLDLGDPPAEIASKMMGGAYSHFPVCDGGLDKVLGVAQVKDLFARQMAGQPLDLTA